MVYAEFKQSKEEHINTTGIKWEEESFRIEDKDEAIKKMKEKYPELKDASVNEIGIDQVAPQVRKEELKFDKDFQKRCDDFFNTSKYLTKDYYKLIEEPKHHIYINNWQYILPNKEDMLKLQKKKYKQLKIMMNLSLNLNNLLLELTLFCQSASMNR